jgi:lysophospholipase L1-like esterase
VTFTDGVHPNGAGAKVFGERLAEELRNIFGEDFFATQKQ